MAARFRKIGLSVSPLEHTPTNNGMDERQISELISATAD
jgi:hypothetical protein